MIPGHSEHHLNVGATAQYPDVGTLVVDTNNDRLLKVVRMLDLAGDGPYIAKRMIRRMPKELMGYYKNHACRFHQQVVSLSFTMDSVFSMILLDFLLPRNVTSK